LIQTLDAVTLNYRRCLEFDVLTAVVVKSSVFRDIMPCSPLKNQSNFQRNMSEETSMKHVFDLAACFMLVSCLAYSSTLNKEATC
jgi:hypothetical protein